MLNIELDAKSHRDRYFLEIPIPERLLMNSRKTNSTNEVLLEGLS